MKTQLRYAITMLAISTHLYACTNNTLPYDTSITVLIDQTDILPVYPSATVLLSPYNLTDDPWQGIQIKVVGIADEDVTSTTVIALEREGKLNNNILLRRAKIHRFMQQVQACIASVESLHSLPNSIIYRTVAKEAQALAHNTAPHRLLLCYSNLLENSEVSFYNPQTLALLERNPTVVEKTLEANTMLPDLTGIQVWFIYAPNSYRQNNVYMPIVRFYQSVYTAHHAQVHVETQFSQP